MQSRVETYMVPRTWYASICDGKGRPALTAITVLALVQSRYWAASAKMGAEELHERGFELRYAEIEQATHLTRDQCKRAFVKLESLGVCKREFRTVEECGVVFGNVMFVRVNDAALDAVTFPEEA